MQPVASIDRPITAMYFSMGPTQLFRVSSSVQGCRLGTCGTYELLGYIHLVIHKIKCIDTLY